MNTSLSLTPKEFLLLAWLEGETLGKVLSTIRDDWGRRTPGYLSQLKMAAQLQKQHGEYAPSQGTISNIENDLKSIMDLQPRVRLDLLKLFPLKESDIEALDERFKLDLPLAHKTAYLNNLGSSLLNSAIVVAVEVVNSGEEVRLPVPRELLDVPGVDIDSCKVIKLNDDVLMTDNLRNSIERGTHVVFSPDKQPRGNNLLVYRCKDTGDFVVLQFSDPRENVPIARANGSAARSVSQKSESLDFLGVSMVRFALED